MEQFQRAREKGVMLDRIVCQRLVEAISECGEDIHASGDRSSVESWLWLVVHFLEENGMQPNQKTCDMILLSAVDEGALDVSMLAYMY